MILASGLKHKGMQECTLCISISIYSSNFCPLRYKYVVDTAAENKKAGAYTQEIETIIHRKAHAIINCYLNSPVPPKVQVKCKI